LQHSVEGVQRLLSIEQASLRHRLAEISRICLKDRGDDTTARPELVASISGLYLLFQDYGSFRERVLLPVAPGRIRDGKEEARNRTRDLGALVNESNDKSRSSRFVADCLRVVAALHEFLDRDELAVSHR